jgi:CDP-diglyceride synthetase
VLVAVFWSVVFLVPFQPPVLAAAITFTVTTIIIIILFSIVAAFCGMVFQTNSSVPKVKNKKSQEKMDEHAESS